MKIISYLTRLVAFEIFRLPFVFVLRRVEFYIPCRLRAVRDYSITIETTNRNHSRREKSRQTEPCTVY